MYFAPDETPRTSQYRFWFDVREPGAAAYAAKLGATAVAYCAMAGAMDLGQQGYWIAATVFLVSGLKLSGGLRQLSFRAALGSIALLAGFCWAVYWKRFLPSNTIVAFLPLIGLPPASWAAFVFRGMSAPERQALTEVLVPLDPGNSRAKQVPVWLVLWSGWIVLPEASITAETGAGQR